jgi:hypothetical protein
MDYPQSFISDIKMHPFPHLLIVKTHLSCSIPSSSFFQLDFYNLGFCGTTVGKRSWRMYKAGLIVKVQLQLPAACHTYILLTSIDTNNKGLV